MSLLAAINQMTAADRPLNWTKEEEDAFRRRLALIRERIADAARTAGRRPESITLVGISKRFPVSSAALAVHCGLEDLGENRVQELTMKQDALAEADIRPRWHMVGTLQKNKVKYLIGRCALIHSADSLELIQQISRLSGRGEVITDLLMQVNASEESTKHGFALHESVQTARRIMELPHIRLRGLMTMAAPSDNPEDAVPAFERTRQLFDQIQSTAPASAEFNLLSMGMSQDYVQAIRCGSTHVRIGTALFGQRPL